MLVVNGFFDNASPAIKVKIAGVESTAVEFTAIIDTGFTGFISMPLLSAFPLGLTLRTTTEVVLADGSVQPKLLAEGAATIGNPNKDERTEKGLIILEDASNEVLVGMDFLRKFRLMLSITQQNVILLDESELERMIKKASERKPIEGGADQKTPPLKIVE